MRRTPFGWWRLAKQVVLGARRVASYARSTFTTNDWDFTADNVDDATDTLTVYDTTGAVMADVPVVFTSEDTFVNAATCTLETDAAEIATTTGVANITAHVYNSAGTPLPGIPAASLSLASTGTGNTITAVDTVTDRNGRFRWTFSSTSAAAKTLTLTAIGIVVTDTAAVTVGTPSLPTLDFFSDWRTATGTGASAVGDGGKWGIGGSGATVIANPGTLDFPGTMTNVLRVNLLTANSGYTEPRKTGLTVPAVGETRYYRSYIQVTSATAVAVTDLETHPIQDGSSASQVNWMWTLYHSTGGTGKWTLQWRPSASANAYPNNRWELTTPLDHDVTYRFEHRIERTGTTTFKVAIRIYTAADSVLRFTEADFDTLTGSTDLATHQLTSSFTFFDAANMGGLNSGSNGLGGSDWPNNMVYSYQGGVATGIDCGWIGAYDSVNG